MKRTYFCPVCRATLNPNVKIVLCALHQERRTLMLFSPRPGNYEAIIADDLDLMPGALVEFRCPVCSASLASATDSNLAKIGFRVGSEVDGHVLFSRRFGEHATYFVTREEMRSYGEDASMYAGLNFFGVGTRRD
jgi:hypothetical protein